MKPWRRFVGQRHGLVAANIRQRQSSSYGQRLDLVLQSVDPGDDGSLGLVDADSRLPPKAAPLLGAERSERGGLQHQDARGGVEHDQIGDRLGAGVWNLIPEIVPLRCGGIVAGSLK